MGACHVAGVTCACYCGEPPFRGQGSPERNQRPAGTGDIPLKQREAVPANNADTKSEAKSEAKSDAKSDVKSDAKSDAKSDVKSNVDDAELDEEPAGWDDYESQSEVDAGTVQNGWAAGRMLPTDVSKESKAAAAAPAVTPTEIKELRAKIEEALRAISAESVERRTEYEELRASITAALESKNQARGSDEGPAQAAAGKVPRVDTGSEISLDSIDDIDVAGESRSIVAVQDDAKVSGARRNRRHKWSGLRDKLRNTKVQAAQPQSRTAPVKRTYIQLLSRTRSYFSCKRASVAAILARSGNPTPAQLLGFLFAMRNQVSEVIGKERDARVVNLVAAQFLSIGWEWGRNRACGAVPPTTSSIIDMLGRSARALNELERVERQRVAGRVEPSPHDLESLEFGVDKLWDLDQRGRMEPGVDYELNLQSYKRSSYDGTDRALEPLFLYVRDAAIAARPTVQAFIKLLDNYVADVGVAEVNTVRESREVNGFLDSVMATEVMQYTRRWLAAKGKAPGSESAFREFLRDIWFTTYRRGRGRGRGDSSAFEHVFVGEARDGQTIGCHNWIQLYDQERRGLLNYKGYLKGRRRGPTPDSYSRLIKIQFEWNASVRNDGPSIKPVGTSWVGTSPEFELALYTMAYASGGEQHTLSVGPQRCKIKCYTLRRGKSTFLSTAYTEEAPYSTKERRYYGGRGRH